MSRLTPITLILAVLCWLTPADLTSMAASTVVGRAVAEAGAPALPELGQLDKTAPKAEKLVLAVIGDYGFCYYSCGNEQAVADLVHSWHPDAILTTGDNSNDNGLPEEVVGDQRPYAADVVARRFFPVHGNHDWANRCLAKNIQPSLDYFGVPISYVAHLGNGLVDFFSVDTTCNRSNSAGDLPEVVDEYVGSVARSTAAWKITGGHHPPYSSGQWSNNPDRNWIILPEIDLYLAGHDHDMEHISRGGKEFVVTGNGGRNMTQLGQPVDGSIWGYDDGFGAVRITATSQDLLVEYFSVRGELLHSFNLHKESAIAKPYVTEQKSSIPPWFSSAAGSTSQVRIVNLSGEYLAVFGTTGHAARLPQVVVQQNALLQLSAFLQSALLRRIEPTAILDNLSANLPELDAVGKERLQEVYAELWTMQKDGPFGVIWAQFLGTAKAPEN